MILRRRCRLALSNHVGHCTLMTKAVLDFTPSLIINLLQFGIDVALLFQQALDVANSALGLRPSAFVDTCNEYTMEETYWSHMTLQAGLG